MPAEPLANTFALVTGSTSGIGRAIALELARAGANLAVHGRTAATVRATADEVRGLKRKANELVTDLAEAGAAARLVESAWALAPVDVWINNAGADVLTGDDAELPFAEKLARLWQVDVLGTIEASRAVGQRMKARGSGVIINIGWDQAEVGMAGDSGEMFAAAKGAIMAFTRSLARSLAPAVRVNCIAPGWIRTSWGETASSYWQDRAKSESLLARWGTPEDIARATCFLASPAASFINGQVIAIDGGFAGTVEPTGGEVQGF